MPSKEKPYSSELKAKIAQEALDQNKQNLDRLSDKYNVPVSVILTWVTKYEKDPESLETPAVSADEEEIESDEDTIVNVEVDDQEISEGIGHGVMIDNLNVKKLAFWSALGIIFVLIFIQLIIEMYEQTTQINAERLSAQNEYHTISNQKKKDQERISSFGVVDIEKGIYRIPVDSVINEMAVDGE